VSSTTATIHVLRQPKSCAGKCGFTGVTKSHHDRLVRIEHDVEEVLDLMELAVTWGELDYSGESLIAPTRWLEFARRHRWQDMDRAERVLSLATDVAMGSMRVNRAAGPATSDRQSALAR